MTSFRFAAEEWRAIERAAEEQGLRWSEWARRLIDANPSAANRAGLLRRAAFESAYGRSLITERATLVSQGKEIEHPMLERRFWPLNDDELKSEFEMLKPTYRADFTSFELIAGMRDDGSGTPVPVLLIRNKLEGELSVILTRDPIDDEGQDDEVYDTLRKE